MTFTSNQKRVLGLVARTEGVMRSDICHILEISPQTSMRILQPLVEMGVVEEKESRAGTRGKPPMLVRFLKGSLASVGIAISRDRIVVEVEDLGGGVHAKQVLVKEIATANEQLYWVKQLVQEATSTLPSTCRIVGAVAVVQGFFVDRGKSIVSIADPIGWPQIDLKHELEECVSAPVAIVNDGTALAGALVSSTSTQHFLSLHVGSGTGGGIVCNGQLIEGAFGNAGEIGRLFDFSEVEVSEKSLLDALEQKDWRDWSGLSELTPEQNVSLEKWMGKAGEILAQGASLAIAILDFDTLFLGSAMPFELTVMLSERINVKALGEEVHGIDPMVIARQTPIVKPVYIHGLASLANQLAAENFFTSAV